MRATGRSLGCGLEPQRQSDDGEKSNEVPPASGQRNWSDGACRRRSAPSTARMEAAPTRRITADNNGNDRKPTGGTATGEVEDYRVAARADPCSWSRTSITSTPPPRFKARSRLTLPAVRAPTPRRQRNHGRPHLSCAPVATTLRRLPLNPGGAGYEMGQWSCEQAPRNRGENSSPSGATTNGRARHRARHRPRPCTSPPRLSPDRLEQVDSRLGRPWRAPPDLTGPGVPRNTTVEDCTAGPCPSSSQGPGPGPRILDQGPQVGTYSVREASAPPATS